MEFPVDLLADVSQEELEKSANDYVTSMLYNYSDSFEQILVSASSKVCIDLSSIGFVPLYGSNDKHKILALFSPSDSFNIVALYLLDRWWTVEDVLRTTDSGRDGAMEVETVAERIVLYVLNRVVYRANEMNSKEELPFLCHSDNDFAKIFWCNGKAVGFYSVKPKGSLYNPPYGRSHQLPVMNSIFVRKHYRRRGFGLKMLEDFVLNFNEESLGLRYPLSEAMYKVCENYLSQYPDDSGLLWEVEGAGEPIQRSSIFRKIHNMKVNAVSRSLLTELNDMSSTTEMTPEQTDEAGMTLYTVKGKKKEVKITKGNNEATFTSVSTSFERKIDVTDESPEKAIRIEQLEAESSEEHVSATFQHEHVSYVTSGENTEEDVNQAIKDGTCILQSDADFKQIEFADCAVSRSDISVEVEEDCQELNNAQKKDKIMVVSSEEVDDKSENIDELYKTIQECLSSDEVEENLSIIISEGGDSRINQQICQEVAAGEMMQDTGCVEEALEELVDDDIHEAPALVLKGKGRPWQRKNKKGRLKQQKQNSDTCSENENTPLHHMSVDDTCTEQLEDKTKKESATQADELLQSGVNTSDTKIEESREIPYEKDGEELTDLEETSDMVRVVLRGGEKTDEFEPLEEGHPRKRRKWSKSSKELAEIKQHSEDRGQDEMPEIGIFLGQPEAHQTSFVALGKQVASVEEQNTLQLSDFQRARVVLVDLEIQKDSLKENKSEVDQTPEPAEEDKGKADPCSHPQSETTIQGHSQIKNSDRILQKRDEKDKSATQKRSLGQARTTKKATRRKPERDGKEVQMKKQGEEEEGWTKFIESMEEADIPQKVVDEENPADLEAETRVKSIMEDKTQTERDTLEVCSVSETIESDQEETRLSSKTEKPLSKDVRDIVNTEHKSLTVCDEESANSSDEPPSKGQTVTLVLVDLCKLHPGAQKLYTSTDLCEEISTETGQIQGFTKDKYLTKENVLGSAAEEQSIEEQNIVMVKGKLMTEDEIEALENLVEDTVVYELQDTSNIVTRSCQTSGRMKRTTTKSAYNSPNEDDQERDLKKDRRSGLKVPEPKSSQPGTQNQTEQENQLHEVNKCLAIGEIAQEKIDSTEKTTAAEATLQRKDYEEQNVEMDIQEVKLSFNYPETLEQESSSPHTFENLMLSSGNKAVERTGDDPLKDLNVIKEGPDKELVYLDEKTTQTSCVEQIMCPLFTQGSQEKSSKRSGLKSPSSVLQEQRVIHHSTRENVEEKEVIQKEVPLVEFDNTLEGINKELAVDESVNVVEEEVIVVRSLRSGRRTTETFKKDTVRKPSRELSNYIEEINAHKGMMMVTETQETFENQIPNVGPTSPRQSTSGRSEASEIVTNSPAVTRSEPMKADEKGVQETPVTEVFGSGESTESGASYNETDSAHEMDDVDIQNTQNPELEFDNSEATVMEIDAKSIESRSTQLPDDNCEVAILQQKTEEQSLWLVDEGGIAREQVAAPLSEQNQDDELTEPGEVFGKNDSVENPSAKDILEDQELATSYTLTNEQLDEQEKAQTRDEVEESPIIVTRMLRSGGKTLKSLSRTRKSRTHDGMMKQRVGGEEEEPTKGLSAEDNEDMAEESGFILEGQRTSSEMEQNSAKPEADAIKQLDNKSKECPNTEPHKQCALLTEVGVGLTSSNRQHYEVQDHTTIAIDIVRGYITGESTELIPIAKVSGDEMSCSLFKSENVNHSSESLADTKGNSSLSSTQSFQHCQKETPEDLPLPITSLMVTTEISQSESLTEESANEPKPSIHLSSSGKKRKSRHVTPRRTSIRIRGRQEEEKEAMTVDVERPQENENLEDVAEVANIVAPLEPQGLEEGESPHEQSTSEIKETEESHLEVEETQERTKEAETETNGSETLNSTSDDPEPDIKMETGGNNLVLSPEILVESSKEMYKEMGNREDSEENSETDAMADDNLTFQKYFINEEPSASESQTKDQEDINVGGKAEKNVDSDEEEVLISEKSLRGRLIPSMIISHSPKFRRNGTPTRELENTLSDERSVKKLPSEQRSPGKRKSSRFPITVKRKRQSSVQN